MYDIILVIKILLKEDAFVIMALILYFVGGVSIGAAITDAIRR